ncbi:MAG: discoidin domain-containing protein [Melioribacteraceae bacterium]|nr:discoidin domain-containing protein [Melioribacteraceae bacterium]
MKRCLTLFLTLLFLGGSMFAQETIRVFEQEAFRNDPYVSPDPLLIRGDGREAKKHFIDMGITTDLTQNVKIEFALTIYSPTHPGGDSLLDPYSHGFELMLENKFGSRTTIASGYTPYGDSAVYIEDITAYKGLIEDSSKIMLWVGTWWGTSLYGTLDLVITPDENIQSVDWITNIAQAAGVLSEQGESRWENSNFLVPGDIVDKNILFWGRGGGEYGTNEVEVKFTVDGTEVYTFSPYVEDCSEYLEFNNVPYNYGYDTTYITQGRTGACIAGLTKRTLLTGDVFEQYVTPGVHTLRFEPQLFPVESWSDFWFLAQMYGSLDENAGSVTQVEFVAGLDKILAQDRQVDYTLYFENAQGYPMVSTDAEIQVSADGNIQFSVNGGLTWANPLVWDQTGTSQKLSVKASEAGTFTLNIEDLSGGVASIDPVELTFEENLARTGVTGNSLNSCNWAAEAPEHSIDGKMNTKWCDNSGAVPMWVTYGFEAAKDINQIVVYHASAGGEGGSMNTGDFELRVHNTATGAWEVFDSREDNEDGITYHSLDNAGTSVNCDSVVLYLSAPEIGGGNVARIYEVEMYNLDQIVSVETILDVIPVAFEVLQNYPNPFNPSTEIKFFTPNQARVDVNIYNILGQEVTHLFSGDLRAGTHTVRWNATNSMGAKVAGGVYFYNVRFKDTEGANFVITKKMLLLP